MSLGMPQRLVRALNPAPEDWIIVIGTVEADSTEPALLKVLYMVSWLAVWPNPAPLRPFRGWHCREIANTRAGDQEATSRASVLDDDDGRDAATVKYAPANRVQLWTLWGTVRP